WRSPKSALKPTCRSSPRAPAPGTRPNPETHAINCSFLGLDYHPGLHPRRRRGMKKIGVLFGMENSFPGALVEHINARNVEGIQAEFVETGAVHLNRAPRYAVIVDRISHDIPFYRAFLKHAALHGTIIINN